MHMRGMLRKNILRLLTSGMNGHLITWGTSLHSFSINFELDINFPQVCTKHFSGLLQAMTVAADGGGWRLFWATVLHGWSAAISGCGSLLVRRGLRQQWLEVLFCRATRVRVCCGLGFRCWASLYNIEFNPIHPIIRCQLFSNYSVRFSALRFFALRGLIPHSRAVMKLKGFGQYISVEF